MAKKYDEADEQEQESIDRVLQHGYAFNNGDFPQSSNLNGRYGLCSSCKEFQFTCTESKVILSRCGFSELKLSDNDPVLECSLYNKRGVLTLSQMIGMAYLLEPDRKKVGFLEE